MDFGHQLGAGLLVCFGRIIIIIINTHANAQQAVSLPSRPVFLVQGRQKRIGRGRAPLLLLTPILKGPRVQDKPLLHTRPLSFLGRMCPGDSQILLVQSTHSYRELTKDSEGHKLGTSLRACQGRNDVLDEYACRTQPHNQTTTQPHNHSPMNSPNNSANGFMIPNRTLCQ